MSVTIKKGKDKESYVIYRYLRDAWDKNKIDNIVETKVLFLDKNEQPIDLETVDINDLQSSGKVESVFRKGAELHAASIVVAQNDPEDNVVPQSSHLKLLDLFKNTSPGFNIRFDDLILFSKWGYNSARENNKL